MSDHVAVFSTGPSDLLELIEDQDVPVTVYDVTDLSVVDLHQFASVAILGGAAADPILLHPRVSDLTDQFLAKGGRLFSEYCLNPAHVSCQPPTPTMNERLVVCSDVLATDGLERGAILDDQANQRLPAANSGLLGQPLLQYARYVMAHSHADDTSGFEAELSRRALWFESDQLLVALFRLSNFVRARFAPIQRWQALMGRVVAWICGLDSVTFKLDPAYTPAGKSTSGNATVDEVWHALTETVTAGMEWFDGADMLLWRDDSCDGVKEGLSSLVLPDGTQQMNPYLRNDCTGEASLAFFLHSTITGSSRSRLISDQLLRLCFDHFWVREPEEHRGMMRFMDTGRDVCYQDDCARALIAVLTQSLYGRPLTYRDQIVGTLDYLLKSTGTNGVRTPRTEALLLTPEKMADLASRPCTYLSAHFNSWYSAALLLASGLCDAPRFRAPGIAGLEALMEVYPATTREHSETQELCRLITPLSFLYWTTGSSEHRSMLYRVVEDLQRFVHPSGAYLEFDTGYAAFRSRKADSECSLLMSNGDPVVDLLYSNNWLPAGLMHAYFVTEDPHLLDLWKRHARFLMAAQIRSADRTINGAWARAFDVDLWEVFGSPYDAGWAHWTVETGWTMAEILSGLMMGLLRDDLAGAYRERSKSR